MRFRMCSFVLLRGIVVYALLDVQASTMVLLRMLPLLSCHSAVLVAIESGCIGVYD
jgi:hypothetical protein